MNFYDTGYWIPDTESGQALLLVLLSMAVILTIALSIVARSVTDITVSTKEDETLRAFSAAEAGVENALITGAGTATPAPIGSATYNVSVAALASSTSFSYPNPLSAGESAGIWFVGHDSNGNLTCTGTTCFNGDSFNLCWGNQGAAITPAVEVSVFYAATPGNYSTIQVGRDAIDPNASRRATNNFSSPDVGTCQIGNTTFAFQKNINLKGGGLNLTPNSYKNPNGIQLVKVRMLYNTDIAQNVGITTVGLASTCGGSPCNFLFPSQGTTIDSTGVAAGANRKVSVFQGFGETPSVFDAAVFSPGGLVK